MTGMIVAAGVVVSSAVGVGIAGGRWLARKRLEQRFAAVLDAVARESAHP